MTAASPLDPVSCSACFIRDVRRSVPNDSTQSPFRRQRIGPQQASRNSSRKLEPRGWRERQAWRSDQVIGFSEGIIPERNKGRKKALVVAGVEEMARRSIKPPHKVI